MSGLRIATLDLGDDATLAELVTVQRAAYRVEAGLIGVDDLPALREPAALLRWSGETFLGAWDEDAEPPALVGALGYVRRGDALEIQRLVVRPSAFRRGIATALLAAVDAAERPRRTIVATAARNAPARRLYARAGFRDVGERTVAGGVQIVDLERRAGV